MLAFSQAVIFTRRNFWKDKDTLNLFYYLYAISSKNHLALDCKKNGESQED